jgi:N-acyl-phosphatidylethanolamine-hydrolysing phospholipase D
VLRWVLYDRIVQPRAADPPATAFPVVRSSFSTPRASADALSATWVGHSTTLIQLGAMNVLTDPVWSERASPVRFAGPRRRVPAAVALDALPPIDLVLLSHNHYDHLDDLTVRELVARHPAATWAAPLGVADFVRVRGARHVIELDWWESASLDSVTLTCAPAQHFSARGIGDRNRTLWCAWSLRTSDRAVFFGGDTAYHPEFARIGARCGPFDATLLPIGAYEPRWFMRTVHMNAEEAVQAHLDLASAHPDRRPPVMIPIHWGTFKLTDEPLDEPRARVRAAWRAAALSGADLWLLAHGETRRINIDR